jgi:DHA1 family tetracycline resistance protein-like MFS transporter
LAFILLAFAGSLEMLFAARVLAGFFGGNLSVAQAYISDITDEKNRGKGFGLIGAAFGLGFILGPATGGLLSQWGFKLPSLVSAGLSLVNLFLVVLWLPESLNRKKQLDLAGTTPTGTGFQSILIAFRMPVVGSLLMTRFFFALAFSMFSTIFALYGEYRFNLNPQNIGYILAYVGFLSVLVQGALVGKLTQIYPDRTLIFLSTLLLAFALIAWAFAPSMVVLLLALIPIAMSGGVLNTVINSAISKSVPAPQIGGTLGLSSSLESLSRVLAPSLGGILLGSLGTWAPGVFASLVLFWLSVYIWRCLFHRPDLPFFITETEAHHRCTTTQG